MARDPKSTVGDFEQEVGVCSRKKKWVPRISSAPKTSTDDTANEGDAREKTLEFCGVGQEHQSVANHLVCEYDFIGYPPLNGTFPLVSKTKRREKKHQATVQAENAGPCAFKIHDTPEHGVSRR